MKTGPERACRNVPPMHAVPLRADATPAPVAVYTLRRALRARIP
jgi:hypothetical protein